MFIGTKIVFLRNEGLLTQYHKDFFARGKNRPTREQMIALRAYHIYLEHRGAPGNAFDAPRR